MTLTLIRIKIDNSPRSFKTNISLVNSDDFRYISCEAILPKNFGNDYSYTSLICGYLTFNQETGKYSYIANTTYFIYSSCKFNIEKVILESETFNYFNIQKTINTYLRYLIGDQSFEIYQMFEGDKYAIYPVSSTLQNGNLSSFSAFGDLFYYNNEYIFSAYTSNNINYNLYISNTVSYNNMIKKKFIVIMILHLINLYSYIKIRIKSNI